MPLCRARRYSSSCLKRILLWLPSACKNSGAGREHSRSANWMRSTARGGRAVVSELLGACVDFRDDLGHWLYCTGSGKIVRQSDYPTICGQMTIGVRRMTNSAYREFNFGLGADIDAVRDQVQ